MVKFFFKPIGLPRLTTSIAVGNMVSLLHYELVVSWTIYKGPYIFIPFDTTTNPFRFD